MKRLRALARLLTCLMATAAFCATIPPVADRDPNPSTSPRIHVERLEVRDFTAIAEVGLAHEDVQAFLDAELRKARQLVDVGAHGFTAAELDEVGRLLNALKVHEDGARLGPGDMEELAALVAEQKRRAGSRSSSWRR